jgi:hypothetical protein
MKIIATKKNKTEKVIFDYPDMSEKEAKKRAKDHIRELTKSETGKRMWGWKFKVQ